MKSIAPLNIVNVARAVRLIASSGPRYGTLFVNTGCNRRCTYCVVPQQGSGVEMGTAAWCRIVDKLHGWGVRLGCVLGGEPTLRRDLPEIISYMSTKMAVSLTSNGDTFVGPKGRDRLTILARGGVSVLNLSLHDLRETDRQLDSLVYAKTLGVIPILATVVTKATIRKLPDIMVEANRRGILYRYMLYQSVGGSFSSQVDGLSPTQEEVSAFISKVGQQRQKTHLVQNTRRDIAEATDFYPRGWHCNNHKDHWVVVDNEGRLMACSEHPTNVSVLDIPSLTDRRWADTRAAKREACGGCSYQCYMDEEGLTRADMVREGVTTGLGLLRAGIYSKSRQGEEKRVLGDPSNINKAKSM